MKQSASAHLPLMRLQGLVIDQLLNEMLVYDLERHQAHCLNQTAALVWRACDGKTTVPEIARRVAHQLDAPFNEELVWLALGQLDQLHLLATNMAIPPRLAEVSRRQLVRNLGVAAAVAVPLIASIVSPTAVQASTCIQSGSPCSGTIACCSVLGCDTPNGVCH